MAQSTAVQGRGGFPRTAAVTGSDDATMSFSGWEPKKLWLAPPDGGRATECAFAEGFDSRADGRSLVSADLDGDGDQDLLMRNRAAPRLQLFENVGPVGRSVEVVLAADGGSPEGAVVFESGRAFPVTLARGFASGVDPVVHIGLGSRSTASLDVRWRSGARTHHDVTAGQLVRLDESGGATTVRRWVQKSAPPAARFPTRLAALGLQATQPVTVVQLFLKGCRPCADEVPALQALSPRVQLVSLGLHEGDELADAARALGISWTIGPLPHEAADALSSSGALPLPLLLVFRDGALARVLPGPKALEAVVDEVSRAP